MAFFFYNISGRSLGYGLRPLEKVTPWASGELERRLGGLSGPHILSISIFGTDYVRIHLGVCFSVRDLNYILS